MTWNQFFRSKITLFFSILIIEAMLIQTAGWIKPVIGFLILSIIIKLIMGNVEYKIWELNSFNKYVFLIIIFLSIPIKIIDIKTRLTGYDSITFESEDSWNEQTAINSITNNVYYKCKDYPELNELKVIIIDVCKDYKGNKRKDTTIINVNKEELVEYRTYKDEISFKSCPDWSFKMFNWSRERCNN
jgi:hypothetical protein